MTFTYAALKKRIKLALLDLRDKINISTELDYPKHKIYMCDNIRSRSCQKEPDTVCWIEGFSKSDTIFDIGSNVAHIR